MIAIKVKLTLREFILWLSGLITMLISTVPILFAYMSLKELTSPFTYSWKIPSLINSLKTSLYVALTLLMYSILAAVVLIGRSRSRVIGIPLLMGALICLLIIFIFILPEAIKYIK